MSGRGLKMAAASLMLAAASCGDDGKLQIRSTPSPYAKGPQAVPHRIAEANGQFALGNVALAIEGYRKAHREDPASLDALAGLAACYDQMGRFDLSRRYHESALAIAPGDARVYANFAASLDQQGRRVEAATLRAEMTQRFAAVVAPAPSVAIGEVAPTSVAAAAEPDTQPVARQPEVSKPLAAVVHTPAPTPVSNQAPTISLPQGAARSVTIALSAPRPAGPVAIVPMRSGPRLERLSLGEVALVTSPAPLWRARVTDRTPRSATIGFRPLAKPRVRTASVILLNAARSAGLAARTRTYLRQRGWSRIEIGDAPKVLGDSTIFYPASRRDTAVRLANQFGFSLRHQRSETGTLTIMLGRDAPAEWRAEASRGLFVGERGYIQSL